jgi:Pyridoxamine 5'-phosphate oxidase
VAEDWFERMRSLLEAPSPAVLTTYRKDGSALVTPVWFRWHDAAFEDVIAEGDAKLRHPARDTRCSLVVFETAPPFRGLEVRSVPELTAATSRPPAGGSRGATSGGPAVSASPPSRQTTPGVLLRLAGDDARVWDVAEILPTQTRGLRGATRRPAGGAPGHGATPGLAPPDP